MYYKASGGQKRYSGSCDIYKLVGSTTSLELWQKSSLALLELREGYLSSLGSRNASLEEVMLKLTLTGRLRAPEQGKGVAT